MDDQRRAGATWNGSARPVPCKIDGARCGEGFALVFRDRQFSWTVERNPNFGIEP